MDVSLRQVRSFLTVARVKSFTGAASVLNVTQPALTMRIRRLEDALGVTFFDRDTRSVELTRGRRDLLPPFERTLQDFDAAVTARATCHSGTGDRQTRGVAIGRRGRAARRHPELPRRRPNVMFDLKDVIAGQVLSHVQSEQVDFGVMGGAVKAPDVETVFEAQDRLHVVYPKGHKIGRLRP